MDELPPDTSHQRVIGRMDVRGGALAIFAVAGAAFAVREGAALLAPLLVSVLLAYALEPCVVLLARCRLPRTLAIIAVYALLFGGTDRRRPSRQATGRGLR